MPRAPTALRLFVAVYPPPEVATTLAALLDQLGLPAHRATPPAQMHMTLQFIGETDPRQVNGVLESVRRSASGIEPFELSCNGLIALPERGPMRLVAATTNAPAQLLEIVRRLALRLARSSRKNSADHFRPHLTLCRFSVTPPRMELPQLPPPAMRFPVTELHLMRSVLLPEGARHDKVAGFPLEGP